MGRAPYVQVEPRGYQPRVEEGATLTNPQQKRSRKSPESQLWFKCQRVVKHWKDWDSSAIYREQQGSFGWCQVIAGKIVRNQDYEQQAWSPKDAQDTPQAHGYRSEIDHQRLAICLGGGDHHGISDRACRHPAIRRRTA